MTKTEMLMAKSMGAGRSLKRKDKMNDDQISRQAAIDIVEFECGEWRGLAKTIVEEIEKLPSVQPERKKGDG